MLVLRVQGCIGSMCELGCVLRRGRVCDGCWPELGTVVGSGLLGFALQGPGSTVHGLCAGV